MKRVVLPIPPDPAQPGFAGSPHQWQAAAFKWMQSVKQLMDDANRINAAPMGQQFQVGAFTTNTTIAGTTTGTDLSNYVASLTEAMTTAGYVSPVRERVS